MEREEEHNALFALFFGNFRSLQTFFFSLTEKCDIIHNVGKTITLQKGGKI